jgi:hypothetical protein
MKWDDEVSQAARRYVDGYRDVEERRRAWDETARDVLLPVLRRACELLGRDGVKARADRFDDRTNASDVEMWIVPFPTGVVWTARDGNEVRGVERPAAMGYGQGDDGRVAHWRRGHSLDDDKAPAARVISVVQHPRELTRELVERHVVEFLREAWETSFRGPVTPSDRPIGFNVPPPHEP